MKVNEQIGIIKGEQYSNLDLEWEPLPFEVTRRIIPIRREYATCRAEKGDS